MGRPAVNIAQHYPEGDDILKVFHVAVGQLGGGGVVEHQQDPGCGQQDEQEKGDQTQAEGITQAQGVYMDPNRMQMQEDVAEYGSGALLFRGTAFAAEDRFLDISGKLTDGFFQAVCRFTHKCSPRTRDGLSGLKLASVSYSHSSWL